MNSAFDRSRSLQELEGVDWGEPTYRSSLVTTCHRLRRKPLNWFTEEDLHIMIGQKVSLPYLIPLAAERLEDDPLVEARFFRGDLLAVVLMERHRHSDWFQRLGKIINSVRMMLLSLDDVDAKMVSKVLRRRRMPSFHFRG